MDPLTNSCHTGNPLSEKGKRTMPRREEKTGNIGITNALGQCELQILDILWQRGEAPVRQVYEEVRKSRNITLPAVMLSMERLTKRGVLQKLQGARAAVYRPLVTREAIGYSLLSDVIDKVLQGDTGAAAAYLVDKLSKKELEQLANRISAIQK